jgi:hypothetical protein
MYQPTSLPAESERSLKRGIFPSSNKIRRFCPVYESRGKPDLCTDAATEPQLKEIGGAHQVACHFPL